MTIIERMENYIKKEDLSNCRYAMTTDELLAIRSEIADVEGIFTAFLLAFNYGRAKGLREAKAGARV